MEIKPRIGFENIKFGMLRDEIIAILGEPSEVLEDIYDEGEFRLIWNDLKLRLSFQNDNRFIYFASKNPDLKFNGQTFMDKDIEEMKKEVFGALISNSESSEWEVEDYDTFKTHFIEDIFLTLHSEYGKVSDFELGVPFKNEIEFDFPK